jgi:hypothetical protein
MISQRSRHRVSITNVARYFHLSTACSDNLHQESPYLISKWLPNTTFCSTKTTGRIINFKVNKVDFIGGLDVVDYLPSKLGSKSTGASFLTQSRITSQCVAIGITQASEGGLSSLMVITARHLKQTAPAHNIHSNDHANHPVSVIPLKPASGCAPLSTLMPESHRCPALWVNRTPSADFGFKAHQINRT